MPDLLKGATPEVNTALTKLMEELKQESGPNLSGLILFGGLARGRFRPGKSDVNLVLLLNDASAASLNAVAPALQVARRSVGVEAMILTPEEVLPAAYDFPTKFLDIKEFHILLLGVDPFNTLDVPRERVRMRVEQELNNLLMRLRNRYVIAGADAMSLQQSLTAIARSFALSLGTLLRLAGKTPPADDRSAVIFESAAREFSLDGTALSQLASLRHDAPASLDSVALCALVLQALAKAIDIAKGIKENKP